METLKVSSKSNPSSVAGALANVFREKGNLWYLPDQSSAVWFRGTADLGKRWFRDVISVSLI